MVRTTVRALLFGLALLNALAALAPAAALAGDCLSASEIRAAAQSGEAVPLSRIIGQIRAAAGGEVLSSPQLCRRGGQLVYLVNVLGSDGQIQRLTVDARTGSVAGY
jgi:uncharacterized membrane protein YkoI